MKFMLFSVICIALAVAKPFEVIEDEYEQEYVLVPISREKRETQWSVDQGRAGISHTGNVFDNNNHRLDATGSTAKNWGSHGLRPDQVGDHLDQSHKPSGSSVFTGADNMRGYGTDVNVEAKYNFLRGNNFGIDPTGGPSVTGKPKTRHF